MHRFYSVLLPSSCGLCGARPEADRELCRSCADDIPVLPAPLCRCGLPLPRGHAHGIPCGRCLGRAPGFTRILAPYAYQWPLDRLLARYKYGRRTTLEAALLALWRRRLPDTVLPDHLVPVPLHWRRQWWRGFNQSARLAEGLARHLEVPVLHALARVRHTPAQRGLEAAARRHNVRRAFRVRVAVEGRRLALVDDVVTTGATVAAASEALLAAGAVEVEVWALARTIAGLPVPVRAADGSAGGIC